MHDKEVITEKETQAVNYNCINKTDCPLSNQCQITSIIYKAKITSNLGNYNGKTYYGTSEGRIKQRCGNHEKSLNHENIGQMQNFRRNTKSAIEYSSTILYFKKMPTNKKTVICYLCLNDKLFIILHQGNDLLN